MNKRTKFPWKAQDEVLSELEKVSNVAALSPEERHIYEVNLRVYRDNLAVLEASYQDGHESGFNEGHESGFNEGHESGVTEGRKLGSDETANKIALSLIQQGFADEMITKTTSLSLDAIQKLRACHE